MRHKSEPRIGRLIFEMRAAAEHVAKRNKHKTRERKQFSEENM
jgi:hypothetical protein